jgi:hypothetical protein
MPPVVLYVLSPGKMIGSPSAPRPKVREFILATARDLELRIGR